jgi:hypothetical protein
MGTDENYCWTVSCKNRWFHLRRDLRINHRIALGITDDFASCPNPEQGRFAVKCDECGKEYFYKPSDVQRTRQELPDTFVAHPRFW